jgi:hypothetical protein
VSPAIFTPFEPGRRVGWLTSSEPGACWRWTGAIVNGYGVVKIAGHLTPAHRAVWARYVGAHAPLTTGARLHNRCGCRTCVNPAHWSRVFEWEDERLAAARIEREAHAEERRRSGVSKSAGRTHNDQGEGGTK